MEGLIDSGETWMEPMLDYRDWLKQIRDDPTRRQKLRRNLQDGLGPFNQQTRVEMLTRLLEVQQETRLNLISEEELSAIQWIWHHDYHDSPIVAEIFRGVTGGETQVRHEIIERKKEERELLEEICAEQGVSPELVEQLVQIERDKSGLMRRHGLFQDIDMALKKYLMRDKRDARPTESLPS